MEAAPFRGPDRSSWRALIAAVGGLNSDHLQLGDFRCCCLPRPRVGFPTLSDEMVRWAYSMPYLIEVQSNGQHRPGRAAKAGRQATPDGANHRAASWGHGFAQAGPVLDHYHLWITATSIVPEAHSLSVMSTTRPSHMWLPRRWACVRGGHPGSVGAFKRPFSNLTGNIQLPLPISAELAVVR
jgi:hypothetical protein